MMKEREHLIFDYNLFQSEQSKGIEERLESKRKDALVGSGLAATGTRLSQFHFSHVFVACLKFLLLIRPWVNAPLTKEKSMR